MRPTLLFNTESQKKKVEKGLPKVDITEKTAPDQQDLSAKKQELASFLTNLTNTESQQLEEPEDLESHEMDQEQPLQQEHQKKESVSIQEQITPNESLIEQNPNQSSIDKILDESIAAEPVSQKKLKEDLIRPTLLFNPLS